MSGFIMTRLNHNRAELRLKDEAKNKTDRSAPDELCPTNFIREFLSDQDQMGSALSELSYQRHEFVVQLSRNFDCAFTHNDLSVFNRHIGALKNPNERSILMRLVEGLLHSHEFSEHDGRFMLERRGNLKWRANGVWALYSNLAGYRGSNGKHHCFSEDFKKKFASLAQH